MRTTYFGHLLRPYGYHGSFSRYSQFIPRKSPVQRLQHTLASRSSPPLTRVLREFNGLRVRQLFIGVTVSGVGLGLASLSWPKVYCDTTPLNTVKAQPEPVQDDDALPPLPTSSVSLYELGFGTVAGVCAGVFVKKGVKAAAWLLGGIFVLLQYLNSASVIRVDWGRIGSRFEDLFYTRDPSGSKKPPTIGSLWNWFIGFLTADFQPRASFVAGFALGLRVG